MDVTARFAELVTAAGAGGDLALDEAALLIAAHDHPSLDVDDGLGALDDLASLVREPTLDGLLRCLYRDLGFRGDRNDYYAPENSFLDQVVRRRTGIPISLSVLTIEVGRRVGVPLAPVGMPGHFLVRDRVLRSVFVDCFAGGTVLTEAGCRAVFRTLHGRDAPWSPTYLDEVRGLDVVGRMLANLRAVYARQGAADSLAWVLTLRAALPGVSAGDEVELGDVLAVLGRFDEAAHHYENAASLAEGEQAVGYRDRARRAASHLN